MRKRAGALRDGGVARALRNRQFRIYTVWAVPSLIGFWVQRVAVGWLTWELTGQATWLGAIAFAELFPVFAIGPFAGALADRLDRLRMARLLQTASMCQAAILAGLIFSGAITVEILFALSLAQGVLNATMQPFRQTIVANLVSREELPPAIAVNAMSFHASRFVGPAAAGLVIVTWGVGAAILLNALSYLFFIYALFRLRLPAPPRHGGSIGDLPGEILEGLRYLARHPVIAPALLILLAMSLFGRATMELLPGFAADVYGRGAEGLAWLTSAAGFGAMLGGLWFAQRGSLAAVGRTVAGTVALLGLSLVVFGWSPWFWLGVASLAAAGGTLTVGGIVVQTMVQNAVADSIRGRVLSFYGIVWLGTPGLGALLMGALSDAVGLHWPVIGAGLACGLAAWAEILRRRRARTA